MDGFGNTRCAARFRALPVEVDALRVALGTTTKADILMLCPSANVGVPGNDTQGIDLRWVVLPDGDEVGDGDWVVSTPTGFEVLGDEQFRARFVPVDGSRS